MKISWSWLGELVELPADPHELAARLTRAGLEVETVTELGKSFAGVVVAEVRGQRPHPGSTRLTLVTVWDGGQGTATEVVCGAPNVPEPGRKVLWARPGARLPDGRVLGVKAVAGVDSPGMLCSETELGLGSDPSGIIVLHGEDAEAPPGQDAQDALGLRDFVLDVSIPANRPDCLGHVGVAREVAALLGKKARRPDATLHPGARDATALTTVSIDDPVACPRYTARVIEGVRIGPSPRWMRRRLEAVGVRSISNLVDISNYVMFEVGQPLHAFDADKLDGGIRVRRARPDETLVTLDGQTRKLEPADILICDARRAVALGGVMGGAETEVTEATTRVLLESATFEPISVRRTARRLALPSEASHRFERGVDANGCDFASARAARLMAELAGGQVARGLVDVYPQRLEPRTIALRPARTRALLGIELPTEEIVRCLTALELHVEPSGATLAVTCPTVRSDLEREVDLIEEVARIHGLDDVPATLPPLRAAPEDPGRPIGERARDALVAVGLDEAQTFGFTLPSRISALRLPDLHQASRPIAIANPMREEQAVLRTSLLPNLLAALARNLSFGQTDVRLFEVGHVFLDGGERLPDEPLFVAAVLCGERPGWLKPGDPIDFYDAKGTVERLLGALALPFELIPARSEDGFLHPGVAGAIVVSGQHVGVVGELHPATREMLGIDRPCFVFELSLDLLPLPPRVMAQPVPRVPAILRDISFFVEETVPAARVAEVIGDAKPQILESFQVLEDYREPGKVPPGKKGMLWSFTYRGGDRTLTDAEVDSVHEALASRLLASLRAERR